MTVNKKIKNINFEDALTELEQQVELLESGELSLEESLNAYQKGVELSKFCLTKLTVVEKEVQKIIVKDTEQGLYEVEPFKNLEE